MNTPQHRGMATPEQLHKLHRAVAQSLLASLKGNSGVEDCDVALRFLKANPLSLETVTDKDRLKLQRLWMLLLGQLTKGLQADKVTASMLDVVRLFLTANGVTKGQHGEPQDTIGALEGLADVPFNIH
jgi:hypothetical protein